MEFIFVKGGCFQMGCVEERPELSFSDMPLWQMPLALIGAVLPVGCATTVPEIAGDCDSDEMPVHEVCVDDFWMAKYEVTQGQWKSIMDENPSRFKKGDDYPVEKVLWKEVQEFIGRIRTRTGLPYSLPSEAEWEYAARSGGKYEKYSGDYPVEEVAWHWNNSNGSTHPVGSLKPNGLGLYDMSGNVWEFTRDLYRDDYYMKSPHENPPGAESGLFRVVRGGAWFTPPGRVRTSNRSWLKNPGRRAVQGFRLSLAVEKD
jgi:formylglycine-generating enzyme required for sulfatase activity